MSSYTVTHPDTLDIATTVARLIYNKGLPQTVDQSSTDANGVVTTTQVPNPALLATNADYVQMIHGAAAQSWYDNPAIQACFRIPSGDWLQRWTDAERKQARAIGAGLVPAIPAATAQQVQDWLDQLDASPFVNLGDPVVTAGVPQVIALLVETGVVAAADQQARIDAITGINV